LPRRDCPHVGYMPGIERCLKGSGNLFSEPRLVSCGEDGLQGREGTHGADRSGRVLQVFIDRCIGRSRDAVAGEEDPLFPAEPTDRPSGGTGCGFAAFFTIFLSQGLSA